MSNPSLQNFVAEAATKYGISGAAVGVWTDDREELACHGVTSIENPLPIDPATLFVLGSVTKTYTATALMCLVAEGKVDLDAPVRRYVPEFTLIDEQAAAQITLLNLLNHTAGLDWRVNIDTGEGDDALTREVAALAQTKLVAPPGTRASYSQAGFDLAGRIIETVTGMTYEAAIASLLLTPLGLTSSFFARDDVMTRRFAVGHETGKQAKTTIARPWRHWRSDNPGAGLASSVSDQLRWARFHLGDGTTEDGTRIVPADLLHRMRHQTVALRGSTLGNGFGICWFLRDIGGFPTIAHGGSANGQFADLLIVPDRNFAVVSLCNGNPGGVPFNRAVLAWALKNYLGLTEREAEPLPYDPVRTKEVSGRYENEMMTLNIDTNRTTLQLDVRIKPEIRAAAKMELPADVAPATIGLLPDDEYIVIDGALKGQRGVFTRDEHGAVVGVDMAGRMFQRV